MSTTLRVVVADDHALVRAGLRSLLQTLPGVEVVGEAGNGRDALRLIRQLHPDVVLMDISMPGLNGCEAARLAATDEPATRILMVSMHAEEQYVSQALAAGATGYLLKSADREELAAALRTVARGERWLSAAARKAMDASTRAQQAARAHLPLTRRQREVLQLIVRGHSTRAIARQLQISVKTVETHRAQLMERLDIHDIASLVLYAVRTGIVRADL